MAKFSPEQFANLIVSHAQTAQPCILCQRPTHSRGVFVGDDGELGALPGKQRHVIYPICERHPPSKKAFELCEKKILEAFTSGELDLSIHKTKEDLKKN